MVVKRKLLLVITWIVCTLIYINEVNSTENLEDILEINRVAVHNSYLYVMEESKSRDDASSNQHLESKLLTLATSRALNHFCNLEPKVGFMVKANLYGITKYKVIIEKNIMKVIIRMPIQKPDCNYIKSENFKHKQKIPVNTQEKIDQISDDETIKIQLDNKTEY
jgi:hypothetical protein